jgi:uncharacterized protein (TIGR03435 family)
MLLELEGLMSRRGRDVSRAVALLVLAFVMLSVVQPFALQEKVVDRATAQFETASIRRNTSGSTEGGAIRLQPKGGLHATNVTLVELIEFAYQRHVFDDREVIGGPAWMTSERFDLRASVSGEHAFDPDGVPRKTLALLKTLLAERFELKLHEEDRERPVYALTTTRKDGVLGPRVRKSDIDCGAVMRGERPALLPGQGPPCGFKTPPGRLFANTFTIPAIASLLSRHLDRPVIDRTGLSGRFDIELEAAEIKAAPDYKPGPSDFGLPPPAGPTIFVALREQLGLQLEPVDASVAVIVIDHAERLPEVP